MSTAEHWRQLQTIIDRIEHRTAIKLVATELGGTIIEGGAP